MIIHVAVFIFLKIFPSGSILKQFLQIHITYIGTIIQGYILENSRYNMSNFYFFLNISFRLYPKTIFTNTYNLHWNNY